jgi:hypothetical protein
MGARPKWPMSAYRASPPVMQSTTEPRSRNPCPWWARKNCTACQGLKAPSTSGRRTIHGSPAAAMLANHTSIAGPKMAPTRAVPRRCTRKSPTRMATVMGTTNACSRVVATSRPSTAESTEMAGVMTPSPYSSAAPKSPSTTRAARAVGPLRAAEASSCVRGVTRARSARMPPSPWLSARRMKVMYFTTITSTSDHTMSDRMPSTLATVGSTP